MRRRAKRDLLTLLGVGAILALIVGINLYMHIESAKEAFEKMRLAKEEEIRSQGFKVLDWDMFREIQGTRTPKFPQELLGMDGEPVNLCGFMSPIDQFADVDEFMLVPVPVTCYFCDAPPLRDIVHVKLAKKGKMVEEPIVVGGWLELAQEEKPKFFSTIKIALWNEAVDTDRLKQLTTKETSDEHKKHLVIGFGEYFSDEAPPELVPGKPAPTTVSDDNLLGKEPAVDNGNAGTTPAGPSE